MDAGWIAALIGAGSGLTLLALFARTAARKLAELGYFALISMLAIYIGARLVSDSIGGVAIETAGATLAAVLVRLAMLRWPPAIGIAILLHGTYDAFVGPHTGVAEWYPPLCAGFDLVVGLGLLLLLRKRRNSGN